MKGEGKKNGKWEKHESRILVEREETLREEN